MGEEPEGGRAGGSVARLHHYVPEFYLAGFTPSGSPEDFLWTHDREQGKRWRARPRNLARERDFYRVEIDGVAPDFVEQQLSIIENEAAGAFSRIREARQLPTGDDYNTLLNFAALQATRVPQFREMLERNERHLLKATARIAFSNQKYLDQVVKKVRAKGLEAPEGITREEMLEFIDDESRYTIEIPRESSIGHMTKLAEGLLPVLAARNWILLVAKDDAGDFVCSDRPVILVPTGPNPPQFIGFGLGNTEVLMPIDRRLALAGRFDHPSETIEVDQRVVGYVNRLMMDYSERFVFSAGEKILLAESARSKSRSRNASKRIGSS